MECALQRPIESAKNKMKLIFNIVFGIKIRDLIMSAIFSTFTIEFMSMTLQNKMFTSYLPESMKLCEKWVPLLVLVFFITQTAFSQEECELRKEKGDLKVYTCASDTKLKKSKLN